MRSSSLRDASSSRTVVITRPKAPSSVWDQALGAAGFTLQHVPLIVIDGPPRPQDIESVAAQLHRFQAIMFVSPQAVVQFFRHCRLDMSAWRTPCWATGGASHAALLKAGVQAALILMPEDESGLWDSEHLWLRVKETVNAGQKVLIVRGTDLEHRDPTQSDPQWLAQGVGREFLSQQLKDKGLDVTYLVAYQRRSPLWDQAQCSQVRALLHSPSVWIFTSSQAARNLAAQLKPFDFSSAQAIATHERIAQELRHLGFGVVLLSRPGVTDVVRSLESLP